MTFYELLIVTGCFCTILNILMNIVTSVHANEQRSTIEAKLDWILMRQSDHDNRLSALEGAWLAWKERRESPNR